MLIAAASLGVVGLVFFAIAALNQKAARALKREIEALDAMTHT